MITIPDTDFTAFLIALRYADASEDKQFRHDTRRDVKEWYHNTIGSRCAYTCGVGK